MQPCSANAESSTNRSKWESAKNHLLRLFSNTITSPKSPTESTTSLFRCDIFPSNIARRNTTTTLPSTGGRFTDTRQLVYCCSVLLKSKQPSSLASSVDGSQGLFLEEEQREWANHIDPGEQQHYHTLISRLVEAFINDPIKNSDAITEIVLVGSVLDKNTYRALLSCFISVSMESALLDFHLLQGLIQLVECASQGYLVDSDLVHIAAILSKLSYTYITESKYSAWALSRILDVMVSGKVTNLNRDRDYEPILQLLDVLVNSNNIYSKYQATYAYQALQFVSNEETPHQIILDFVQSATHGVPVATSNFKIDSNNLLDGMFTYSQLYGESTEINGEDYKTMSKSINTFHEGGKKATEISEISSLSKTKYSWYIALQGTTMLIHQGRLNDFNMLVSQVPCRNNANFQWGICRQLGEIVVDPLWDVNIRQQAVEFLGELYRCNSDIELHDDVKRWVLTILIHIMKKSDESLKDFTVSLVDQLKQNGMEELPGSHPLNTTLPQSALFPLLAKAQNNLDLEARLLTLRSQQLKEHEYFPQLYIPPMAKPNLRSPEDTLSPLMTRIKNFLSSNMQVMLILGDSGSGKSTFCKNLEYELWKEYKFGDPIPLYIDLPALIQPESKLISGQLRIHGFFESQILELQQQQQFILICNGYSEAQLVCNLHATNLLHLPEHQDTKLIITCRSQYLGPDYHSYFVPAVDSLFQECVITPFSNTQIEDFVEQYVLLTQRPWVKSDYMNNLKIIPNLMDLARNPFLLSLCLEALPNLVQETSDASKLQVTRARLYDSFIQQWLEVNTRRFLNSQMEDEYQKVMDLFLPGEFKRIGMKFQTDLATAMFHEQDGNPIVEYTHRRDKDSWKAQFFGADAQAYLIRSSSLLMRAANQYKFVHKSLQEYFYSRSFIEPINLNGSSSINDISDRFYNSNSYNDTSSIGNHPLSRRSLVTEPSVIQFLSEHVHCDPKFKQQLLDIIEISKTNKTAAQAAANSMTILVRANIVFSGQDLRGIRIPGADLSEGVFDSVQLQGSDLTGVNLSKSSFRQADLTGASMANAYFGKIPNLKFPYSVYSCAYSSDEKSFAVGLESGEIIIFETTHWTQPKSCVGHSECVLSLAFSPCGNQLLSGSDDMAVRLWQCTTGLAISVLEGHTESVNVVAFSPRGNQIASGSDDNTLRIWDPESGVSISVLSIDTLRITKIAYMPDGVNIVYAGDDGATRIFNTYTRDIGEMVKCDKSRLIVNNPDTKQSVSWNPNNTQQLMKMDSNSYRQYWGGHNSRTSTVTYSLNSPWTASGNHHESAKLWSAQPGNYIYSFTHDNTCLQGNAAPQNGHQSASEREDAIVQSLGLKNNSRLAWENRFDTITSIGNSMDGLFVFSCTMSGDVFQYDSRSGEHVRTIQCECHQSMCLALSPDGLQIAIADKESWLWNLKSEKIATLHGHQNYIRAVAFSPCGRRVATGCMDKKVRIWDANSGKLEKTLIGHARGVSCLQFSSTGQQIVSISYDGGIYIWETDTANRRVFYKGRKTFGRYCVVFSPDDQQIAENSSDDCSICIRDKSRADSLHTLKHDKIVLHFAWSFCGQWIAAVCGDTIWLWACAYDNCDIQWKCAYIIRNIDCIVGSVFWIPNTLKFSAGCGDGSVRVWQLVEDSGGWSVQLSWSAGNRVIVTFRDTPFGAVGLSPAGRRLLE